MPSRLHERHVGPVRCGPNGRIFHSRPCRCSRIAHTARQINMVAGHGGRVLHVARFAVRSTSNGTRGTTTVQGRASGRRIRVTIQLDVIRPLGPLGSHAKGRSLSPGWGGDGPPVIGNLGIAANMSPCSASSGIGGASALSPMARDDGRSLRGGVPQRAIVEMGVDRGGLARAVSEQPSDRGGPTPFMTPCEAQVCRQAWCEGQAGRLHPVCRPRTCKADPM